MRSIPTLGAALSILLLSICSARAEAPKFEVVKTLKIGGQGSWDYLTVDPQTHQLYVPRSTHTLVLDESGKTIADIPGQTGAHGVAVVPEAGRGFISDGGDRRAAEKGGAVFIFDLKTNQVLGKVATPIDTDGIIFDKASGRLFAVAGDAQVLVPIKPDVDPKSGKADPEIALGGGPEFLASDGAGKVFVNVMDKDEVAVVDTKADKVIAHWPVAPGGQPVGMAIDTEHHRLFIGCRKPQKMIVMSTDDGKVLADVPIGASVDATKFDNGLAFASCRDGTLTIVGETSPGKFDVVQTVKTPQGARTMGIDPTNHMIYLPTAEFEEATAGARPRIKPDSFMIVVVGPNLH